MANSPLTQFYDKQSGSLRMGGIIGAVLGGLLGGQLTFGASPLVTVLGAAVMGFVGAWLGNRASDKISGFMHRPDKNPDTTPAKAPKQEQAANTKLEKNNQSLTHNDITPPSTPPRSNNPADQTVAPHR